MRDRRRPTGGARCIPSRTSRCATSSGCSPSWRGSSATACGSRWLRPRSSTADRCRIPITTAIWRAFVEHGVRPVFHVADQRRPFADAWYTDPPDAFISTLDSVFLWTAAALACTDLILNGTLERHPDLRIGIVELERGVGADVPDDARRRLASSPPGSTVARSRRCRCGRASTSAARCASRRSRTSCRRGSSARPATSTCAAPTTRTPRARRRRSPTTRARRPGRSRRRAGLVPRQRVDAARTHVTALLDPDGPPRHDVPAGGHSAFTMVGDRQVHYLAWGRRGRVAGRVPARRRPDRVHVRGAGRRAARSLVRARARSSRPRRLRPRRLGQPAARRPRPAVAGRERRRISRLRRYRAGAVRRRVTRRYHGADDRGDATGRGSRRSR